MCEDTRVLSMCVDEADDSLAESGFVGCLAAVVCISILAIFVRDKSRHALLKGHHQNKGEKGCQPTIYSTSSHCLEVFSPPPDRIEH